VAFPKQPLQPVCRTIRENCPMCTKIHIAGQKQNPRHGRLAESTPLYCKSTINDAFGGGGNGNNKCFDVIDRGIKGMWDAHIIRRVSIGTEDFYHHLPLHNQHFLSNHHNEVSPLSCHHWCSGTLCLCIPCHHDGGCQPGSQDHGPNQGDHCNDRSTTGWCRSCQ
jgi:hypothetical protein